MKADKIKKLIIKIASGIFALSMVFSATFANFNFNDAAVETASAEIVDGMTGTDTDVEERILLDSGASTISASNWQSTNGVHAVQRSHNMRFNFASQDSLVSTVALDPWGWGSGKGYTYGGALVVEWDAWHNNVESANFGFIYGQAAQSLCMEATKANCISFYGMNSLFYGTLENKSSVIAINENGVGEYPPNNRWVDWERSAKMTLFIHANGRQELYQNNELIAYVTLPDITTMGWRAKTGTTEEINQGFTEFTENTFNRTNDYTIRGTDPLAGYCGFAYRSTDSSDNTLDLTLNSLRVGYIQEDWFYNNGYQTLNAWDMDDSGAVDQGDIYRTGQPSSLTNPFATDSSGYNSYIEWQIDAANNNGAGGLANTGFTMMDKSGNCLDNTVNVHTRAVPGWYLAETDNYGFYINPLSSGSEAHMLTTATLPDYDARMGGQRYAMLDIRTWLAGLADGVFTVKMVDISVEIKQTTEPMNSDPSRSEASLQKTAYHMYIKDGDTYLTDAVSGEVFVPLKIYDNALLRISLWGSTMVSVSYGRDELNASGNSYWKTADFTAAQSSGKTAGQVLITASSNSGRCLMDDFSMHTFTPKTETFDDATLSGWTITTGISGVSGGAFVASSRSILCSNEQFTNFVMEFDSPTHTAGWLGVTFGMETQNQAYTSNDCLFLLFNNAGNANFTQGGKTDDVDAGLIEEESDNYVPVNLPVNIGTEETPKYPTAHMFWDETTADEYGASIGHTAAEHVGMVDKNVHFKLVLYKNILTVYVQFDGYEQTMLLRSVDLSSYGTYGYVAIQSASESSTFTIDNLTIMEASANGVQAVNTFLNMDGSVYAMTKSTPSASNAMDVAASTVLPATDPTLENYTFVGWMDTCSGDLISKGVMMANHGGRTMTPLFVAAYANSMTTGGNIQTNFYLEYKSALADRGNRIVLQMDEYNEDGSLYGSQVQVSTDDDIKQVDFKTTKTDGTVETKKTYKFYYEQDPKNYRNRLHVRVRVGGVDFFDPRSTSSEDPWVNYSLDTYLLDVAWRAKDLEAAGDTTAATAFADYAANMRIFCELARQYFDDSYTDVTYAPMTEAPSYQYWADDATITTKLQSAWNDAQSKTSANFVDHKIQIVAHNGCKDAEGKFKDPTGFKYKGFTTVFELGTELRFICQFPNDSDWFYYEQPDNIKLYWGSLGGTEVKAIRRQNNGISGAPFFYVPVQNLAAKDLDQKHDLTVHNVDTGEWFTIRFSVLGYARSAIQTAEKLGESAVAEDIKLAAFCRTLLLYRDTAAAYAVYAANNS